MTGLSSALQFLPAMVGKLGLTPAKGVCSRHGEFESAVLPGRVPVCMQCVAEQERVALVASRRQGLLLGCGVPGRYREAKFRDLEPVCEEQRQVIDAFKGWVARAGRDRDVGNVVLLGGTGTGKTHMACAAALNLIGRCGLGVCYTTTARIKEEVCSAWGMAGRDESSELRRFASYPLLIIDEVDVFDQGPALRMLNSVIDRRSADGLPTIYISNQDRDRLIELVGIRAVSRMLESALILQCGWGDYRLRSLKGA
ncbi:ATP-binding protein [Chromobacterium phragmitis]|uniref:ATP-binding protein n=1 Tax=Chromobacterium amazonense TaxID=1382803 RepID=UPI0021B75C75|nr:ATP-binding protein [Chromobacterium amazonense]MBM2884890.1 ATP-binding protein [Chromobacterium amazonense]MDE1714764.1 ATP-binding protein [Chromobacterium amazonense]